jgi:predicted acylesterase/phospholipase RssA
MASGSYPVNFDYASLEVESYYPPRINGSKQKDLTGNDITQNDSVNSSYYKKKKRYFWDGGLMSNTPLSQLVLMHRNYWYQIRGVKEKVPTLGICVINVHPKQQLEIPTDHDGVVNRNNDITFSDRSHRDEEVLLLISDYIDLVKDLIKIGKENGIKDEVLKELMNRQTKYHGQVLKPRKYKEIIEGSFDIAEVVRIERKNDENTISDKTFDFSSGTIENLLQNGYDDTMNAINSWRTSNVPE